MACRLAAAVVVVVVGVAAVAAVVAAAAVEDTQVNRQCNKARLRSHRALCTSVVLFLFLIGFVMHIYTFILKSRTA